MTESDALPLLDTERLRNCPICGCEHCESIHDGLTDRVFATVSGTWGLCRCLGCGVAFLNPRPTAESILKAYETYYTHSALVPRGVKGAVRDLYIRGRFGRRPFRGARLAARVVELLDKNRTHALRRLGRSFPPSTAGPRLLDIGCGDGAYARAVGCAGWEVVGLEADPKACAVAQSLGVRVICGKASDVPCRAMSFDVIRLHHVIEHLHDPKSALQETRRLLRPGGIVMIGTPNLQSNGHHLFGRDWLGLDPPRHLVLFDPISLVRLLQELNFRIIEVSSTNDEARFYFEHSYALSSRCGEPVVLPPMYRQSLADAERSADVTQHEVFTIVATRP